MSAAKVRAQIIAGLSNKRQLMLAWYMYPGDHNDLLVLNTNQSVNVNGVDPWIPPGSKLDWGSSSANTSVTLLVSCQLGPYCGGQFKIFTSPGDVFLSPIQQVLNMGKLFNHRARSVAMDAAIGGDGWNHPADNGKSGYKPPASLASSLNPFFFATKLSQMVNPGPSKCWVFLNEHPDSIDDGIFYDDPRATDGTGTLIEVPSSYLGGGCGVSFADGHAEVHKWTTSAFLVPVKYAKYPGTGGVHYTQNEDMAWLAQHTPAH
ncbi:MAG TPA: hypothetical protein VMA35_11825 [Candidatus Sulfopaludibacter sp.]|nr:hypothetical protein [Candidatus Sulfopaludibacter sp.]